MRVRAARNQQSRRTSEIGLAQFQKRRLPPRAGPKQPSAMHDIAHGLIGAFDARAMGEDDEPGHT